MATILQLEKLIYVKELLVNDFNTLEYAVASERISDLINKTEQLLRQREFLREERRKLRLANDFVEEKKKALQGIRRGDWIPKGLRQENDRRLKLNIGGFMFEVYTIILQREPSSLLAQLATERPPVAPDSEGVFTFDRDWWVFRYVLLFLRDGSLPNERNLLAKLYRESQFWQMRQLQLAIEEEKLHLRAPPEKSDDAWWRTLPSWFLAVETPAPPAAPPKPADWWRDEKYGSQVYGPLSTDSVKVVTNAGEIDAKPMLSSTWALPQPSATTEVKAADPRVSVTTEPFLVTSVWNQSGSSLARPYKW